MGYSVLQKLRGNIEAIGIALRHEAGTALSRVNREVLMGYAGFGGIKTILYPDGPKEEWTRQGATDSDLDQHKDILALHGLLRQHFDDQQYKEIVASLKESVLSAFYTPAVVPAVLYQVLGEKGILPQRIYEPSAGAGIFITEAFHAFPELKEVKAVEKDLLTSRILNTLLSDSPVPAQVMAKGFEESNHNENGNYDLVVSNIPFGNYSVYDPSYPDKSISGKIHNYFFAKGLDKLAHGGLMAFVTTSAFLNTPSNEKVREYLFKRADFVSLTIMPDNLMTDTGNTQAPTHLLIVQKNTSKKEISKDEYLLIETEQRKAEDGSYNINRYVAAHENHIAVGDNIKDGKDQYGKPSREYRQDGTIAGIAEKLKHNLETDFDERFNVSAFQRISFINETAAVEKKQFEYLPMPPSQAQEAASLQLGLFDAMPAATVSRALDYISEGDAKMVQRGTARMISTISTTDRPSHESLVLLTAQSHQKGRYLYKLYANVNDIALPAGWCNADQLDVELKELSNSLRQFDHQYIYSGDGDFKKMFALEKDAQVLVYGLKPFYKEGMLFQLNGKIGLLEHLDENLDRGIFSEFPQQGRSSFYQDYIGLRNHYLALDGALENPKEKWEQMNRLYEHFVLSFGQLNTPQNAALIRKDAAFGPTILGSLERKSNNAFIKADVLLGTLEKKPQVFHTDHPLEALARSLNDTGKVSTGFIAAALEKDEDHVVAALQGHIYLDPVSGGWLTADHYLSGNVIEKLKAASRAAANSPDNPYLQESLEAIRSVQPERIPFALLDFNFGERWIPADYYSRYASEVFELSTQVIYFSSMDTYKVKAERNNVKLSQEYAIRPKSGKNMYGENLMEHALENTAPLFTYEVKSGEESRRYPDSEATQLAHQKIERLRQGFNEWLQQLPVEEKLKLETLYNETFNCYRLREYDGSHQQFPGFDRKNLGIENPYRSQYNAVWRIVQNRGALIDHEVGLGKTLTMILAAQEMKRLGICQKPMILALKANVDQIRDTYQLAYPGARIIAPNPEDFSPANRVRLFHEIRNNKFDCVIITHDQFAKIPQSREVQQKIFTIELENVERDMETARSLTGETSKQMLKGLEIRKKNLANSLKSVAKLIEEKKDDGIDFVKMGIDHLFVDESHKFKNLTFTTRHNRVAGLGNVEGSQKALNLLFAVRTLQHKFDSDICATFLSGTPISNSLTELYLIFKYLRPREMERQGISNFDGWAAVFAKKTTDFEFSVTNEIIAKERFRHFIKVPELALFYNEITDYKTALHIKLDKPEVDETLVNIAPTSDQQQFIKRLMEFARTGNAELIGRPPLSKTEDLARMLIATNMAKKMALDMRLIKESYADHPNSKVNVCARQVAKVYHESSPNKGTQLVFCDIGTPNTDGFNIYDALKEKLVRDFRVPAHEISFIHDSAWANPRLKPGMFRKMNEGKIRVLFGSTEKAGTGLNVQRRMVAMHHLDIPWKPSELEQRNGRGARQGNIVAKNHYGNKVRNYIYATEQSLDNYKFNLLKNKQLFISQMKNNNLNVRSIDEGSLDEKSGMNFAEYIAILSGDTTLLEKAKLDKQIAVLENLKKAHFKAVFSDKWNLQNMEERSEKIASQLVQLKADQEHYHQQLVHGKDGTKANPIRLEGISSVDAATIGKRIIYLQQQQLSSYEPLRIGSLYGYDLFVRHNRELFSAQPGNTFYASRNETGIRYTYNDGHPNSDNPKLAARYFLNSIDQVDNLLERHIREFARLEKDIKMLQRVVEKPFEKEKELAELKLKAENLEREISLNIQKSQMKQNGDVNEVEERITETKIIKLAPENDGKSFSMIQPQESGAKMNKKKKMRM
ncbi:MAG: DNA methylase [Sphingobacteriales bacterium]|nr:DNA methylase [Sphingobacteriales bacterium]OJV98817.1 MAG: DNA methylase [Sphingobacteriales bacterium 44-61]